MTFQLERPRTRQVERLHDQRTGFRRQPAIEDERAVVVVPKAHASVLLLARLARQLLGVLAAAIRTNEFLDVLRGAVLGDHQQVILGLGGSRRA